MCPANAVGQILAAVVMLVGIGFVTVITASITGAFVERSRSGPRNVRKRRLRGAATADRERLDGIEAALRDRV